jgi:hypothetical protein
MPRLREAERLKTTVAVIGVLAVSAMPAFAAHASRLSAHFGAGQIVGWAKKAERHEKRLAARGPFVPLVGPIDYGTAENRFGAARSGHVHAGQDMSPRPERPRSPPPTASSPRPEATDRRATTSTSTTRSATAPTSTCT